jgi:hypothetical protein
MAGFSYQFTLVFGSGNCSTPSTVRWRSTGEYCSATLGTSAICSQAAVDGVIFEFSELTTAFAPEADELLLCY